MIELTQSAKTRIVNILIQHHKTAISFSVTNTGCNGHSYKLDFIDPDKIAKYDEKINLGDDLMLIIPASSIMFLLGTVIDFKEEKFGSSFQFINPQEASKCGCGESVSFK